MCCRRASGGALVALAGLTAFATFAVLATPTLATSASALDAPAVGVTGHPIRGDRAAGDWSEPVPGRVARGFVEPASRFASGHRGVDFAAPPGTPVRAAGPGTVSFAGSVAGSLHVVVAHQGGLRTSYSFLSRVDVVQGQAVTGGAVVGVAGGLGPDHTAGVLHFGLRLGDRYLDPMILFRPRDLTKLVRLVPAGERAKPPVVVSEADKQALLEELGLGGGGSCGPFSFVCDAVSSFLEAGLGLLADLGGAAAVLASKLAGPLRALARQVVDEVVDFAELVISPLGRAFLAVVRFGGALFEWLTRECQDDAPPADGTGGSGNALLAVGGIESHRDAPKGPSFDLSTRALGYRSGDVHWFSYRDDRATYGARDTYGDLREKARLLSEQLKAAALEEPGRVFDLIAHSQGGVVIDLFLIEFWEGHESEYPPIGAVVTFATPHDGSTLATVAEELTDGVSGRALAEVVGVADEVLGLPIPDPRAKALEQLAEGSDVIDEIQSRGLPEGIHAVSIAGAWDPIVTADNSDVEGAQSHVIETGAPWESHGGITSNPRALMAARAAIEHKPLPCTSLAETAVGVFAPALYDALGDAAARVPLP